MIKDSGLNCSKNSPNLICSLLHGCNLYYCRSQIFELCHTFDRFITYLYIASDFEDVTSKVQ
jgi:hypothetical protein